jgi:hypothetical protein
MPPQDGVRMIERPIFLFQGQRYFYFDHPYNFTATNERAVEIPLALAALQWLPGPVLEIGNVLSHYGVYGHTIVDRDEVAEGVLNVDVETFSPDQRFSSIVSISTLEHLGWDEEPKDAGKVPRVLAHLLNHLLVPGGHLLATAPMGYNPHFDYLIRRCETGTRVSFLSRVSVQNRWQEVVFSDIGTPRYGYPFPNGNLVAVLTLW